MILGATGISQFGLVHAQTLEKGRGKRAPDTIAPGIVKQKAFGANGTALYSLTPIFAQSTATQSTATQSTARGKVDGVNSGTRERVDSGNKSYAEEQSRTDLRLSSG